MPPKSIVLLINISIWAVICATMDVIRHHCSRRNTIIWTSTVCPMVTSSVVICNSRISMSFWSMCHIMLMRKFAGIAQKPYERAQMMQKYCNNKKTMFCFRCKVCGKQMNMVRRLRSHLEVHIRNHPTEGIHRCKVCNKRFVSESYLKIHMKKNHVIGNKFENSIFRKCSIFFWKNKTLTWSIWLSS